MVGNIRGCGCCDRLTSLKTSEYAQLGEPLSDQSSNSHCYQSVTWHGLTIKPGDALFLEPDSFLMRGPDGQIIKKEKSLPTPMDEEEGPPSDVLQAADEEKYPEKYRKTDLIKGSNNDTPDPFCIGYVSSICFKGIVRKFSFIRLLLFFSLSSMSHPHVSILKQIRKCRRRKSS